MKRIPFLVLSILVLSISCDSDYINKSLKKSYSDFEPEFINHIPDSLTEVSKFQVYRNQIPDNDWLTYIDVGRLFVQLEFKENSNTIEKLNEYYLKNNIFIYRNEIENIIIPLKFKDSIYSKEHKKKQEYINYINRIDTVSKESIYPLPNFKYTFNFENETLNELGIPFEFETYVIETKNGRFTSNGEHLMPDSNMYFPNSWLHGISKGVSIDVKSNSAIYWVIYW